MITVATRDDSGDIVTIQLFDGREQANQWVLELLQECKGEGDYEDITNPDAHVQELHKVFVEDGEVEYISGWWAFIYDGVVDHRRVIEVSDAERATTLAALRLWQQFITEHPEGDQGPLDDIATNGDTVDPLNPDDIDALCERINGEKA